MTNVVITLKGMAPEVKGTVKVGDKTVHKKTFTSKKDAIAWAKRHAITAKKAGADKVRIVGGSYP